MQGRKTYVVALAAVLAAAAGIGFSAALASAGPEGKQTSQSPQAQRRLAAARRLEAARLLRQIDAKRTETWRWQRVMGPSRTQHADSARRTDSIAYRRWVLDLWAKRAGQAKARALHPPRLHDWLCIHHYEGSWTDPNAPYYGGLQMDLEFQQTYGSYLLRTKGTADHWTPLEQIWVADRAYRSGRGFYPWPNTASYCGLI